RCLVVPEPGLRGPVYLGACHRMSSTYDLQAFASAANGGPVKFPIGPYAGSASIANHMQCDHVKGVRTATDLSPHVLSLSTNVELLTAIANDTGYENIFVYQLQSQSEPGDVLLAVSSSGRSPNIVRALT